MNTLAVLIIILIPLYIVLVIGVGVPLLLIYLMELSTYQAKLNWLFQCGECGKFMRKYTIYENNMTHSITGNNFNIDCCLNPFNHRLVGNYQDYMDDLDGAEKLDIVEAYHMKKKLNHKWRY